MTRTLDGNRHRADTYVQAAEVPPPTAEALAKIKVSSVGIRMAKPQRI